VVVAVPVGVLVDMVVEEEVHKGARKLSTMHKYVVVAAAVVVVVVAAAAAAAK
jgi:hypothetical protein